MVYGPLRHTVKSVKELNQSNSRIYDLFVNSKKDAELPPNGVHTYVDVRVSIYPEIIFQAKDRRISQPPISKLPLSLRRQDRDLSFVRGRSHLKRFLIR